jgi:transforming growth factor-beta-induced protein
MKKGLQCFIFGLVILLGLTACGSESPSGNITEVASERGDLSTLVAAVEVGGLAETLAEGGPYTVFAPDNAAFDQLPDGTKEALLDPINKTTLSNLLTYHVVEGKLSAADLKKAIKDGGGTDTLTTVNGDILKVTELGDYIVLLDAFGKRVTITAADLSASNGMLHVVNTVLNPNNVNLEGLVESGGNIMQFLNQNSDFSTMATAVKAAGLASLLTSGDTYTVFAPVNEGFAKLPEGALDEMLKDENKEALAGVLKYHIIRGGLSSKSLRAAIKGKNGPVVLTMLNGEKIEISLEGEAFVITDANGNRASVTAADMSAYNGVIHILDGVMMPPSS